MRLTVGDHRRPAAGGVAHQLIEARQRAAEAGGVPGQQPTSGLAVGAAVPRLAQLTERGLEDRPAGRDGAAGGCRPPGHGSRPPGRHDREV